ncbi:hypothetical protein [Streptomyces fuscigenes]|uniref:hypothetical protein n=1 Tax=Streptomyces fuscigenes TaxID=1528880 RepID=UPI001F30D336|nr:hypothetical protein [Streptomyces fuscigenes]MCF3960374.1 hypothetical protein [Streptomyces fuscigenes]
MTSYVIKSGDRAEFIGALRELADFLAANPDVVIPRHPACTVFVDAESDPAREEGMEFAAAPLGAPVVDLGRGFYCARRWFGPIEYSVTAVPPKDTP